MAVTCKMYGKAMLSILNKEVDLDTDVIKMALVTSSYTFNQDTHDYFNDITNEVSSSGTNYTAGGATLASKTVTYTGATNICNFDCADVSWSSATFTARGAVVYVSTGVSSTSALLCFIDFGEDKSVSNNTFTVTIDANGLFKFTVAA